MRKALALTFGAALVAGMAYGQGTIVGSAHDFSGQPWTDEICQPCHAPHNNLNAADELLWNHNQSTATYSLYSSTSMDAAQPTDVSERSKTCLSCHDGTVNVDAFGGSAGTAPIAGTYSLGTELFEDHPISMVFCDTTETSCTDNELNARTGGIQDTGSLTIADVLNGTGAGATVECSSCHDVHNTAAEGASLLYADNDGSGLCLKCHNK